MKTALFLSPKNLYWDIKCAKDNLIPFIFDCFVSLSLKGKQHLPVAKVHFPLNHDWIKPTAEAIYSMKKKIIIVLLTEQLFVPLITCTVLKIVENILDFSLNIKLFLF